MICYSNLMMSLVTFIATLSVLAVVEILNLRNYRDQRSQDYIASLSALRLYTTVILGICALLAFLFLLSLGWGRFSSTGGSSSFIANLII